MELDLERFVPDGLSPAGVGQWTKCVSNAVMSDYVWKIFLDTHGYPYDNLMSTRIDNPTLERFIRWVNNRIWGRVSTYMWN